MWALGPDLEVHREEFGGPAPQVDLDAQWVRRLLMMVGAFDEARVWYQCAYEAAARGDAEGRIDHDGLGLSLHQVGLCLSETGAYLEARGWYERAVAEWEQGDVATDWR